VNENHSTSNEVRKQRKRSTEWWTVFKKHLALFAEHYRQPINELSTIVYAEDLRNLTPAELDAACIRARQTSEYMPVSAAILKAHGELTAIRREGYLGPPLLAYPEVSEEERAAALEFSDALRKQLAPIRSPKPPEQKKLTIILPSTRSIEEQKAELRRRGFLK